MRVAAVVALILAVSIPFGARAQDAEPSSDSGRVRRREAEPVDPRTPLIPEDAAHYSPPAGPMPSLARSSEVSPQIARALAIVSPILSITAGALIWKAAGTNDDGRGVGATLILAGLWVAPSIGHMYAGEWQHAVGWSVFRAATSTLAGGVLLAAAINRSDCEVSPARCDTVDEELALGAGLILVASASAVYDMFDASRAAERTNQRLAAHDFALAPILSAGAGGSTRGLALVARF